MSNVHRLLGLSLALGTLSGCPDKEVDTGSTDYTYIVVIPTDNSEGFLHRATILARGGNDSSDQLQFTQETGLSDDSTTLQVEPGETVWLEANAVMEFGEGNGEDDGTSSNLSFSEVLESCRMEAGEVNTVVANVYCPEDADEIDDCDFDFYYSADPDHDRDSGCATLGSTSTDDEDDSSSDSSRSGLFGGGFSGGGLFGH